jgi:hypothetical protein
MKMLKSVAGYTKRHQIINTKLEKVKVKLSLYRPWKPFGWRDVEVLTFSDIRLTGGGKVVSPTRRPLLTPGRFLVHISLRG